MTMDWVSYTKLKFATGTRAFKTWVTAHVKTSAIALAAAAALTPLAVGLPELKTEYWKVFVNGAIAPLLIAFAAYIVFLARAPVEIFNRLNFAREAAEAKLHAAQKEHLEIVESLTSDVETLTGNLADQEHRHAKALATETEKRLAIMLDGYDTGIKQAIWFCVEGYWPTGDPELGTPLMGSGDIVLHGRFHDAVRGFHRPLREGKIQAWAMSNDDKSDAYMPINPSRWATIKLDPTSLVDDGGVTRTNLFQDTSMGLGSLIYYDIKLSKAQVEAYYAVRLKT